MSRPFFVLFLFVISVGDLGRVSVASGFSLSPGTVASRGQVHKTCAFRDFLYFICVGILCLCIVYVMQALELASCCVGSGNRTLVLSESRKCSSYLLSWIQGTSVYMLMRK